MIYSLLKNIQQFAVQRPNCILNLQSNHNTQNKKDNQTSSTLEGEKLQEGIKMEDDTGSLSRTPIVLSGDRNSSSGWVIIIYHIHIFV